MAKVTKASQDNIEGTNLRGLALLTDPLLNKGTAFTAEERDELGLCGLWPPLTEIRSVSKIIAKAVVIEAINTGISRNYNQDFLSAFDDELDKEIEKYMWYLRYKRYTRCGIN